MKCEPGPCKAPCSFISVGLIQTHVEAICPIGKEAGFLNSCLERLGALYRLVVSNNFVLCQTTEVWELSLEQCCPDLTVCSIVIE